MQQPGIHITNVHSSKKPRQTFFWQRNLSPQLHFICKYIITHISQQTTSTCAPLYIAKYSLNTHTNSVSIFLRDPCVFVCVGSGPSGMTCAKLHNALCKMNGCCWSYERYKSGTGAKIKDSLMIVV